MANIFYSNTGLYTPAATNTILFAQTAGYFGRVLEVSWGGFLTTTTAMLTRWTRSQTAISGTTTNLSATILSGGSNPPTARLRVLNSAPQTGGSYAAPIALYATAWNAHGGIGRWLAAPGEEWVALAGAAPTDGIWCNNDQGTTASSASFGLAWSED